MHYLKPKLAKLPLPPEEAALTRRRRQFLDSAIEKINEVITITHAEIIEEAAARKAARAAAAAQPDQPRNPPPKPAKTHPQGPRATPPETPAPAAQANPTQDPSPRPRRGTKPEILLLYLVRAMESCIRLDIVLADRLAGAHTTSELAGLNHPNRQPILDYMHKVTRQEEPYQFQRTTHDALETRISEELAWAPDRNPADIIVEICTHYNLPYDPNDFPNNWRPTPPTKPPPTAVPRLDPDEMEAELQNLYNTINQAMQNRHLQGRDR